MPIYDYEIVLRGDSLPRPVNYALVRVVPPAGTVIDNTKAPVVVIDRVPARARHWGIQAGKRGRSGVQGETSGLRDRLRCRPRGRSNDRRCCAAFTVFLEKVIELQPPLSRSLLSSGTARPVGMQSWPPACGLIRLGRWSLPVDRCPIRRRARPESDADSGELLGGTWTARLLSDLGGGIFDGAWLVSNFDNLNWPIRIGPNSTTSWPSRKRKSTATWISRSGGGLLHFRGEELEYMVDNLFVGNKLSTGQT